MSLRTFCTVALSFNVGLERVVCEPRLGQGNAILDVDVFALDFAVVTELVTVLTSLVLFSLTQE